MITGMLKDLRAALRVAADADAGDAIEAVRSAAEAHKQAMSEIADAATRIGAAAVVIALVLAAGLGWILGGTE